MWNNIVTAVFVLSTVFTQGSVGSRWDDPCNINMFSKSGDETYHHIRTLPQNCSEGSIDWHYPEGQVLINFTRPDSTRPFTLCLFEHLNYGIDRITDVTDETSPRDLKWNSKDKDKELCVKSHGTDLKLEMEGPPSMQTYMDSVKYNITEDARPDYVTQNTTPDSSNGVGEQGDDTSTVGGAGCPVGTLVAVFYGLFVYLLI